MSLESLKSLFETIGIVAVGITFVCGAAALILGNRINKLQAERLRQFDRDLKSKEVEIANINRISGEAIERAGKLENDNLNLRGQVAGVETEMAKQKERAAIAERALLQLRESLKDRTISPAEHKILVEALRGTPSGPVDIWWTASDSDSFGLANQMIEIFKEAGWPAATEHFAPGGTGNGFFIAVRDRANAPAYAVSIQNAYKLIGIDMNGFSKADVPEGRVQIYIGHKTPAK